MAIYSTYNYIINMLRQILDKISGSMLAIIGNSLTVDVKQSKKIFDELNSMMYFIAIIICVPLLFAINLFIDLWYGGQIQTNFLIGTVFSIYLFGFIIKIPITTYVSAAGLFKETKKCAITDTIVNLVLSLILVWKMGICGVVLATFISVFIAEYIMKNMIAYKYIFKENVVNFYVNNIKFIIILCIDVLFSWIILKNIVISNIVVWFLVFSSYFIVNLTLIYLLFKLIKEDKFIDRYKFILKRGK